MDKTDLRKQLTFFLPDQRVKTDYMDLIAYASDASFYRLIPKAVVQPIDTDEIIRLFRFSKENKIPLTFRAGGTSLSGQSVTDGILVDISKYWRKSIPMDGGEKVFVQPGITGAMVNAGLKKYSRKLGPDPSSIASALMGGILANNSSGMCCGVSQNSYHTLSSIKIVLPDGNVFNTADKQDYIRFMQECPQLYQVITNLKNQIEDNGALVEKIRSKYKIKNTVGYALNSFLDYQDPLDILAHLFIGSEGTLGFIAEAILDTVPDHPFKSTGMLYFPDIHTACSAIIPLKETGAEALELMDRAALSSIENMEGAPDVIKTLPAGAAALLCEYQSSNEQELEDTLGFAHQLFGQLNTLSVPDFTRDPKKQDLYWKIRKGMFPAVGAVRAQGTSIILEDVAFPLHNLANAVVDIQSLFPKHNYEKGIIFGHAKDGNIHFVVSQSFNTLDKIRQYENFINDVVSLVVDKYDGTLKAEHGTGRNMAPFVETEWGEDAYQIMKAVKMAIDPDNLVNPGVIITDDAKLHLKNLKSMPVVEKEVDQCIECGYCEHRCPSRDLTTTPRQRIVVRREMARAKAAGDKISFNELWRDFQYKGLDTCAVDGLCSTDCPVDINTGELTKRLRKENHSSLENRIATLISKNFKSVETMIKYLLVAGEYINKGLGRKTMFHITSGLKKVIPSFPLWPVSLQGPADISHYNEYGDVVYFPSCITSMMGKSCNPDNSIVQVIQDLSDKAGIKLIISKKTQGFCCGQAFSSKGYTHAASVMMEKTINQLWEISDKGRKPIVMDVSSCTHTLRNAFPLISLKTAEKLKGLKILDSIEFAEKMLMPKLNIKKVKKEVVLHPVCSLSKMKLQESFKNIAYACAHVVKVPVNSGCCGMAGDKGFLFPELPSSALKGVVQELGSDNYDGYYSSGKTCELALSSETDRNYKSILYLLQESVN